MAGEVRAISSVLKSSQWSMTAGRGLTHERLESEFAEFVGCAEGVAVGSGGMALQISLRALGLRPGDEVLHQVDTCSATSMAVIAAGGVPMFSDTSRRTFMLDVVDADARAGSKTKALIGSHMWGNAEDTSALRALADKNGMIFIEDACLSLGASSGTGPIGRDGDASVFSFGCLKPIQCGEGGMIVTNDRSLAKEMRALRHWGDRTAEFGVRDTLVPSWNGRMSELLAAVVREQLKGYPRHLAELRASVKVFSEYLATRDGLQLVCGMGAGVEDSAFTQVVLRVDESKTGIAKKDLMERLYAAGIQVWHANFEPITKLSFFHNGGWKEWYCAGDFDRIDANYGRTYEGAEDIYASLGLGLSKSNFLSRGNLRHLVQTMDRLLCVGVKK
jgi:dTDP-4-amino-4,6-dideoxygalactose transaminase